MSILINNTEYHIEEFDKGCWHWFSDKYESSETFGSAIEALQAAIDNEQTKIEAKEQQRIQQLEDEVFGTEEQQIINHYNKVIRS